MKKFHRLSITHRHWLFRIVIGTVIFFVILQNEKIRLSEDKRQQCAQEAKMRKILRQEIREALQHSQYNYVPRE